MFLNNSLISKCFSLILGVPKETLHGERRVAITPSVAASLIKKGFTVNVESGAGVEANFKDAGISSHCYDFVKTFKLRRKLLLAMINWVLEFDVWILRNCTLTISDYEISGANVVDKKSAFNTDIVLKVRAPTLKEAGLLRDQVTKRDHLYFLK